MNITPKVQLGGFDSLFSTHKAVVIPPSATLLNQVPTSSTSLQTSKTSSSDNLIYLEILKSVKEIDGLPSEIGLLANNLYHAIEMSKYTTGDTVGYLTDEYIKNISQMKIAKFNKQEFDKTYELAKSKDSLNTIAITATGQVVVLDEQDNIQAVSVSDYLKNRTTYKAVTNGNLLHMRSHDPEYAFNNLILSVVTNGISLSEIDKMIKDKIMSIGTTTISKEGYSIKQGENIILGFDVLSLIEGYNLSNEYGMTLDGLYKHDMIVKEQKMQAMAALKYIYATLPTNAKTLLSLLSGNSKNPEQGALDIILLLITSKLSPSTTSTTVYEGTLEQVLKSGTNSSKSNGSSNNSSGQGDRDNVSDDFKMDPYTSMIRLIGGTKQTLHINPGTNYAMDIDGTSYGAIPNKDGAPIASTSLASMLNQGVGGIVSDTNGICFGNVPVKSEDFRHIMFNGEAGGTVAILPIKINNNGVKVVNLDIINEWEEFNKELKNNHLSLTNNADEEKIVELLSKHKDLLPLIDQSRGKIDFDLLQLYLIVDGFAVDHTSLNKYAYSNYVQEVSSENTISTVEKALTVDKDDKYEIDTGGWGDHNVVYEGSIFIPITYNQLQSAQAAGQKIKEPEAMEKEYDYLLLLNRLRLQNTKTDAIYSR